MHLKYICFLGSKVRLTLLYFLQYSITRRPWIYMSVNKVIIDSSNDMFPIWHQNISQINAHLSSILPSGTGLFAILIKTKNFPLWKCLRKCLRNVCHFYFAQCMMYYCVQQNSNIIKYFFFNFQGIKRIVSNQQLKFQHIYYLWFVEKKT